MKIKIKPRETFIVTSLIQIPGPPLPRLPAAEENAVLAEFIEQMNVERDKQRVPTREESATLSRFVEHLKASEKNAG